MKSNPKEDGSIDLIFNYYVLTPALSLSNPISLINQLPSSQRIVGSKQRHYVLAVLVRTSRFNWFWCLFLTISLLLSSYALLMTVPRRPTKRNEGAHWSSLQLARGSSKRFFLYYDRERQAQVKQTKDDAWSVSSFTEDEERQTTTTQTNHGGAGAEPGFKNRECHEKNRTNFNMSHDFSYIK
jgi:hypothetical protein